LAKDSALKRGCVDASLAKDGEWIKIKDNQLPVMIIEKFMCVS
jgi:hypothetical protein